MDHTRFGVELVAPLPIFRGEPGDRLAVRVGHEEAIMLCRVLPPNYGAVVEALEYGLARPLNPTLRPEELVAILAATRRYRPHRERWPRALRLER